MNKVDLTALLERAREAVVRTDVVDVTEISGLFRLPLDVSLMRISPFSALCPPQSDKIGYHKNDKIVMY